MLRSAVAVWLSLVCAPAGAVSGVDCRAAFQAMGQGGPSERPDPLTRPLTRVPGVPISPVLIRAELPEAVRQSLVATPRDSADASLMRPRPEDHLRIARATVEYLKGLNPPVSARYEITRDGNYLVIINSPLHGSDLRGQHWLAKLADAARRNPGDPTRVVLDTASLFNGHPAYYEPFHSSSFPGFTIALSWDSLMSPRMTESGIHEWKHHLKTLRARMAGREGEKPLAEVDFEPGRTFTYQGSEGQPAARYRIMAREGESRFRVRMEDIHRIQDR